MKKKDKIVEKFFCPICGSAAIRPVKGKFMCLNCKAIFSEPKKAKIELKERPSYIG